mgnify:CR=1 FL=1
MFKALITLFTFSMLLNAGTIKGTVSYAGSNKKPKTLKMDSDPVCGNSHDAPPAKEDFILDENNNFKNVIVWLKDINYDGELSTESALIDQIGCVYTPHVNAVTTAQKVLIKNSDKTLHNVNSKSKINEGFNSAQPAGVPDIEKTFSSPEDPFYIKCDVHPWMKAWVMVADHPYFAITDANGNFEINNVPDGTYEVMFWQEKLSNLPKKKYIQVNHAKTVNVSDNVAICDYTFPKPKKKPKK